MCSPQTPCHKQFGDCILHPSTITTLKSITSAQHHTLTSKGGDIHFCLRAAQPPSVPEPGKQQGWVVPTSHVDTLLLVQNELQLQKELRQTPKAETGLKLYRNRKPANQNQPLVTALLIPLLLQKDNNGRHMRA